jgi:FkbM family methyltransferase
MVRYVSHKERCFQWVVGAVVALFFLQLMWASAPVLHLNRTGGCTLDETGFQADNFHAAKIRGCPNDDDVFMRLIHSHMPDANVFFDIGSNKGFTGARFYSLWNPHLGMTSPSLYRYNKQQGEYDCGACGDCRDETKPFFNLYDRLCSENALKTSAKNERQAISSSTTQLCKNLLNKDPIRVYSFDGNPHLVGMLELSITTHFTSSIQAAFLRDEFTVNTDITKSWSVENLAFTNTCAENQKINFVLNGELGHVETSTLRKGDDLHEKVSVDCVTVDAYCETHGIEKIDILKIDTEGNDPFVIDGAKRMLSESRVGVVLFEFNEVWPKSIGKSTALEHVITFMAKRNYVCYFEGKNTMVRLTGCFAPLYNKIGWSNVFCVQHGTSLQHTFDSLSLFKHT